MMSDFGNLFHPLPYSTPICSFYIRYVEKLAQNRPLMSEPLEIVKFVCKDFWDDVFKKKVCIRFDSKY